jgi:hypothetical protein
MLFLGNLLSGLGLVGVLYTSMQDELVARLHAKLLVVRILNGLIVPLVMGGQGSGIRGFSPPV